MHMVALFAGIVILACAVVYVVYVTHHATIANALLDKASTVAVAEGPLAWVKAKFIGWKTIALSWLAVVVHVPEVVMNYVDPNIIKDLPWIQVLDAKTAGWITIACALLIPLTHNAGQKMAALTQPNYDGSA